MILDTRYLILTEAISKLESYCAYQERCEQEVRDKLAKLTVPAEMHPEIFQYLREQGFLDDARFAKTYASSKLRLKKWGKLKISQALKTKGIRDPHLSNALKALDWNDYYDAIRKLLEQKGKLLKETNSYTRQQKLAQFVIGKGFEPNLVWEVLKEDV
ncbi:regulatory protein RecX [soil metagenome]